MADQTRVDAPAGMKAYGYPRASVPDSPMEMEQVTIVAGAATLRRLAEFLERTADLMEQHGDTFGHEHFSDFDKGAAPPGVEIIVSR